MIKVNIHQAKAQLSHHLSRVEREGITIVICRRNVPIAEIRPLPATQEGPREIGPLEGTWEVPESFFDPLPGSTLDAFEGKGDDSA